MKRALVSAFLLVLFCAASANSQTNVIYNSPDGYLAGVILDKNGNLYGGTYEGGTNGWGSIFELSPGQNNQWTPTTLYNFSGPPDAAEIPSSMVFDSAGNLYGSSYYGGTGACIDEYLPPVCLEAWPHRLWRRRVSNLSLRFIAGRSTSATGLVST
jgi:hypothetical protein